MIKLIGSGEKQNGTLANAVICPVENPTKIFLARQAMFGTKRESLHILHSGQRGLPDVCFG